jgi:Coenzyme PQQ synthesis protein D (PqqD)
MFEVGKEISDECIEADGISAVRFARKSEFVTRTIAGEAVLVPIRGQIRDLDAIYHFNEVGAFIWNLLDGKTSVCYIAHAVCLEFDVALEDSERDTLEFVDLLQGTGIIAPTVDKDS